MSLRRLRERTRTDQGAVAIFVAILIPVLFVLTALALDVARWYLEASRLQTAADAAAMAGVTSLNDDSGFDRASQVALDVAAQNGYAVSTTTSVVPFTTARKTELGVSVSAEINNTFGAIFGRPPTRITRTAIADFQGAAIMGSPCNAFGNQPNSTTQAALPWNNGNNAGPASGSVIPTVAQGGYATCATPPQFWALIEGPAEDKINGDRYMTTVCDGGDTDCDIPNQTSYNTNLEYTEEGYFWIVRVEEGAVGTPISLQLYDPAYINTGARCEDLPGSVSNSWNPWAPDATSRYDDSANAFCTGDNLDGSGNAMTTSFGLRYPTPTLDPLKADPVPGCARQYEGTTGGDESWWEDRLDDGSGSYDEDLVRVFHQWTELCTFTPLQPGDYYLQVRTNVALGSDVYGAANQLTYDGANAFSIRASISPIATAASVAVSGWERMPIWVNATGTTSTTNLIQVLSNAAGKSFEFTFYDFGDGLPNCPDNPDAGELADCTGTVRILYPLGATLNGSAIADGTSPANCTYETPGNSGTPVALTGCTATLASTNYDVGPSVVQGNNGRLARMTVQVPEGYVCDYTNLGSCWFRAQVTFPTGETVNDVTTWDAFINGDSIRIVR